MTSRTYRGNTRLAGNRIRPSAGRVRQRGGSIIEVTLMIPWIFFLFVGILDFGYFGYALLSTENAAREAAVQTAQDTSSQSQGIACSVVSKEMTMMPNYSTFNGACTTGTLQVQQATLCGKNTVGITCGGSILKADGTTQSVTNATPTAPPCADCASDSTSSSSLVSVSYKTIPLIPIPLVLNNQFTFTRTAEMRIIAQ